MIKIYSGTTLTYTTYNMFKRPLFIVIGVLAGEAFEICHRVQGYYYDFMSMTLCV